MGLGREADNGHSLARLDPMNQVGGKADTCGGLSTDTAFLLLAPTGIPRPNRSTDVDGCWYHLIPLIHLPAAVGSNGAEGVVAVEPEAVFHGWRPARRECLLGGTQ